MTMQVHYRITQVLKVLKGARMQEMVFAGCE